jgi:beta-lactamase regulating signal transducer with metallopeptidase domain
MNWLHYLLEVNIYLGVFYLCYCLFLNKETWYMLNRFYLLFSTVISFILPVIQVGILKPAEPAIQNIIMMNPGGAPRRNAATLIPVDKSFNLQDALLYIYLLGAVIFTILLAIKLYQLLKLTRSKYNIVSNKYKLIYIDGSNTAFSFFNYLFIGTKAHGVETIIRHELVHIRQKHSLDIVLLELLKIISWFNPLIYLLQNSLKTVHEYIADETTAAYETNALTYSTFLCNNAYGIGGPSITHSFFNYNLLKKRIIMLNQKRSGSLARLKYLLILPVCTGLLCVSTLGFSKTYGFIDLMPQKADTVLVVPPPPPEPPSLKHVVKFGPPVPPFGSITKKGYRYTESGYLVDGKRYFSVIIQESKNVQKEFWKNKVSPAEVKMLRDKYGYTFPTMNISPKLPPPPPQKPKVTDVVLLPPPPQKPKVTDVALPPPPPMEPHMPLTNAFAGLDKYIGKYTRYPAVALENKVTGSVIAQFELNADHKITNVTLISGIGNRCDEEAIRVLNNFTDPIDAKPGTYKLAVTFTINTVKAPKPASETLRDDPLFIGEVVIGAYL